MKCDHDIIVREILINLSQKDFLNIGMDQIAYIRPLKLHTAESDEFYAVHAADGTPISVVNSMDSALASVKSSEMHAVTVH